MNRRRITHFTLRGMLFFLTLFCLWLGYIEQAATKQRQAVAALQGHRWQVRYDFQVSAMHGRWRPPWADRLRPCWVPLKIQGLIGIDYFSDVVSVSPDPSRWNITRLRIDDQLRTISTFSELRSLELYSARISDEAFANLDNLTNLEYLRLSDVEITAFSVEHLARFSRLRYLALEESDVLRQEKRIASTKTDMFSSQKAGVGERRSLNRVHCNNLEYVGLRGTTGADLVLHRLGELPRLLSVDLRSCSLSDSDVSVLAGSGNIEELDLSGNPVGNRSVEYLVKIGALRELRLANSDIADRGVLRLISLPNLKLLDVQGTRTTEKTIRSFQQRRPHVTLGWTSQIQMQQLPQRR